MIHKRGITNTIDKRNIRRTFHYVVFERSNSSFQSRNESLFIFFSMPFKEALLSIYFLSFLVLFLCFMLLFLFLPTLFAVPLFVVILFYSPRLPRFLAHGV